MFWRERPKSAPPNTHAKTIEAMADGEPKFAAQKEISAAQDAMLAGKMGACASHLSKAMHTGGMK